METVIRQSEDIDAMAKRPGMGTWGLRIAICLLGALILMSAGFAALNASQLGWRALILLGGMALVGGFGLLSFFSGKRDKPDLNERRFADRSSPYSEVFFKSPQPSLIVRDGKPGYF